MATQNLETEEMDAVQATGPAAENNTMQSQLGELDKVRSILFGEQIHAYEIRIQALEDRLREGLDAIRFEMKGGRKELEDLIQARTEELTQLIEREQASQAAQNESIGEGIRTAFDFAKEQSDLQQERLRDLDTALRASLKEETGEVLNDLNAKIEALTASLKEAVGKLSTDKLNRAHISQLLVQMAEQLERDS